MDAGRSRGKPGPAPLTAQREQFARLTTRGVSNAEACRLVGVNRRTGTRWRFGRTVTSSTGAQLHDLPVATTGVTCLSERFLSEDERVLISDRVRIGVSLRAIGRELGRSPSTVSREVRRNRDEAGRYRPLAAHRMALRRLRRPKERRLAGDPVLRGIVQGWLDKRWSPEQIANTLRVDYPEPRPGTWCTRASTRRSTPSTGRWGETGSPVYAPDGAADAHVERRTRDGPGTCAR